MLRVANDTPYDMPIRFALATGARQAEVLGATWGAIDVERGTFHVIKTLKIEKREFRMAPRRRTARAALIELSRATVQLLLDHRDEQNAARLDLGEGWEDHDLVFPAERGRYWHRVAFHRGFRQLLDVSTIERPKEVNFHTLRHTAASQ